jgi:hypothetical protein
MDYYHWYGYERSMVSNHPFARVYQHQGTYPLHRLCGGIKIGFKPFQLVEAQISVRMRSGM